MRDKSKIRVYRIDCVIRGVRRCVRSAVRYHPRLFFSRTRALVSLVLNLDRRAASPLSLLSLSKMTCVPEMPTAYGPV